MKAVKTAKAAAPRWRDTVRLNREGWNGSQPVIGALAMGAPMALLLATGHAELLGYASMSSFAANYTRNRSYKTRLRLVPLLLGLIWVSSLTGSLAARATSLVVLHMLVLGIVAVSTQYVTAVFRAGLPGGLMPTFACALGLALPVPPGGLRAAGVVMMLSGLWTFAVTMAGWLINPHGPERGSVAQALEAVADRVDAIGTQREDGLHLQAAVALQQGWHAALAGFRTDDQTRIFQRWCTAAEAAMHRARAGHGGPLTSKLLRQAAATLRRPIGWPDMPPSDSPIGGTGHAILQRTPTPGIRQMTRHLLNSPQHIVPALRVGLAAALCLLIAWALGLEHPAWTVLTCAAILQTPTRVNTVTRAMQRSLGTLLGMGAAIAVLLTVRDPVLALVVVVACHALGLALAGVNYALLLVPVTPMALLLVTLGHPHTPWGVVGERMFDTIVGATMAVGVAYLVPNRGLATSVERAEQHLIWSIIEAMTVPSDATAEVRSKVSYTLVQAMTALRLDYNQASGEPWPSDYNIDMATISQLVEEGHEELIRLNPPPSFDGGDHPLFGHPSLGSQAPNPEENGDGKG